MVWLVAVAAAVAFPLVALVVAVAWVQLGRATTAAPAQPLGVQVVVAVPVGQVQPETRGVQVA
jgi:hypothetical protein